LIKSLFPQTDHQLCTVHLQRNAYRHLNKEDYEYFRQGMKEIFNGSSFEAAHQKLLEICEKLGKKYKGFIENIKTKAENYINFTKYPSPLWGHLRTTNMPEGLNNEIEKIKRDSGGYFHTEKELMVKMRIMTIRLYRGKWKKPSPKVQTSIQELTQMFYRRFEGQSPG
jgi:transposase-like protein